MSGTSQVLRPAGPTVALSVVATSHAAVAINIVGNDVANFVALINTGTVVVAVRLSVAGTAATLPVDGTPGDFVLPVNQLVEIPLPSPVLGSPCQITAIGATAGPSLIYCTPIVMQT